MSPDPRYMPNRGTSRRSGGWWRMIVSHHLQAMFRRRRNKILRWPCNFRRQHLGPGSHRNRTEGHRVVLTPHADLTLLYICERLKCLRRVASQQCNQALLEFSPPITYIDHARIEVTRESSALLLGQCDPFLNIKRWTHCSPHNATGLGNQRIRF